MFENKRIKKINCTNTNQRKAGVAVPTSRSTLRPEAQLETRGTFHSDKGINHQDAVTSVNTFAPNKSTSKCIKKKRERTKMRKAILLLS